jgi:hypothetical protein
MGALDTLRESTLSAPSAPVPGQDRIGDSQQKEIFWECRAGGVAVTTTSLLGRVRCLRTVATKTPNQVAAENEDRAENPHEQRTINGNEPPPFHRPSRKRIDHWIVSNIFNEHPSKERAHDLRVRALSVRLPSTF